MPSYHHIDIFKGEDYYRMTPPSIDKEDEDYFEIDPEYPKKIRENFIGLVPPVQSALFNNFYLYFFNGDSYSRILDKYEASNAGERVAEMDKYIYTMDRENINETSLFQYRTQNKIVSEQLGKLETDLSLKLLDTTEDVKKTAGRTVGTLMAIMVIVMVLNTIMVTFIVLTVCSLSTRSSLLIGNCMYK